MLMNRDVNVGGFVGNILVPESDDTNGVFDEVGTAADLLFLVNFFDGKGVGDL